MPNESHDEFNQKYSGVRNRISERLLHSDSTKKEKTRHYALNTHRRIEERAQFTGKDKTN